MTTKLLIDSVLLKRIAQYTPSIDRQEDRARAISELRSVLESAPATVQGDAVRASLSADNQRITPPDPIISKPHPMTEIATAQGVNQQLLEALVRVEEDINWMINSGQMLNRFVFNYVDEAIAAARKGEGE